jgi:hypothetical protein
MKFYLIEISTGDSKIAGKGIYEYDSRNKAVAMFHKKLGTAMDSELYDSEQIFVVNDSNVIIENGKYEREVVIEEPEVVPEESEIESSDIQSDEYANLY